MRRFLLAKAIVLIILIPCFMANTLADDPERSIGTAEMITSGPTGFNESVAIVRMERANWEATIPHYSYVMEAMRGVRHAELRFAADDQRLHLSATIIAPPEERQTVDIFLGLASGGKHSVLNINRGNRTVSATDIEGGVILRAAIPWSRLELNAAPESLRLSWEVHWNNAAGQTLLLCRDGLIRREVAGRDTMASPELWAPVRWLSEEEARAELEPAELGLPELVYDLPENSIVSIVIDDTDGRRVRNLTSEAPRLAGTRREFWDGRDDEGRLLQPGEFTWRGIRHTGLEPEYLISFNNPGNPPYITNNASSWGADHDPPRQVAYGGGRMYLGWNNCEAGSSLIATDLTGSKQWGWRATLSAGWNLEGMAADEQYVYLAKSGWGWGQRNQHGSHLIRFDGATGRTADWPQENGGIGGGVLTVRDWADEEPNQPPRLNGFSIGNGMMYIGLARENIVEMRDLETGALAGHLNVELPGGSTVEADGNLLVLSGKTLLRINPRNQQRQTLAEFGNPRDLTTDRLGRIYVSDWAAHQVIVLDRAGREVRRVGRPSGRQTVGAWQNDGLIRPEGIAIDHDQQLWVAENDTRPKRISVWTLEGAFKQEFIGPSPYGGCTAYMDPEDITIGYSTGTKFRLDYETRTYEPIAVLGRNDRPGAIFWNNAEGQFIRHNGRRFFVTMGGAHDGTFHTVFAVEEDRLRALSAIGTVGNFRRHWRGEPLPQVAAAADHDWFSWSDRNGDALVQADELQVIPSPTRSVFGTYWGAFPSPDLTFYLPTTTYNFILWKWPVTGWTDVGAPIYDLTQAREFARYQDAPFQTHTGFIGADAEGRVIVRGAPVMAFRPDGTIDWTYPSRYAVFPAAPTPEPGRIISVHLITGVGDLPEEAGGQVFVMNGNEGEWYFMTTDGIFIDKIFRDQRVGGHKAPPYIIQQESFGGYFTRATDGNYYIVAGHTDNRVFRVDGIDSLRRLDPVNFTYTNQHYAVAQQRLAEDTLAKRPAATSRLPRLESDPDDEGFARTWPEGAATQWTAMNRNEITVHKAWTPSVLQLRYEVVDSSPMRNNAEEPKLLFRHGDAVDIQIAANPEADAKRGEPAAGDRRLLMSEVRGENIAVLYEPVVPGTQQPVAFASPWRSVNIDRVTIRDEVRMRVTRQHNRYIVNVAVPWTVLGITPRAGLRVQGDFGVLFSDDAGGLTTLRAYWSNQNTSVVSDVPSEVTLEPRQWGNLIFE